MLFHGNDRDHYFQVKVAIMVILPIIGAKCTTTITTSSYTIIARLLKTQGRAGEAPPECQLQLGFSQSCGSGPCFKREARGGFYSGLRLENDVM